MHWALVLFFLQSDDPITNLRDIDPDVRAAAAVICGKKGIKTSLPVLIELLRDEKLNVRDSSLNALTALTGKRDLGPDYQRWRDWWREEGSKEFPATTLTKDEVQKILEPHAHSLEVRVERLSGDLEKKVEKGKTEIRAILFFVIAVGVLFLVIMLYFVGHVMSKIKEWKDFIRQAEVFVQKGEEITRRTDQVLDELEAKKTEILDFTRKQREEAQTEIERYTDLIQEKTEHQLREEVMSLRQKAEKELEQTLGELRTQVEHEIRRGARGHRESIEKEFASQRASFLEEVQAHTLFLEGSFYTIHGKPEDALRQYKKLLSIRPDHLLGWSNLGGVYRQLLRYDDALEAYQHALTLSADDPNILYHIAATYARLKQKDRMLEMLSKAIANDGEYKDEALNDTAFREYWNDPKFKDLAEV